MKNSKTIIIVVGVVIVIGGIAWLLSKSVVTFQKMKGDVTLQEMIGEQVPNSEASLNRSSSSQQFGIKPIDVTSDEAKEKLKNFRISDIKKSDDFDDSFKDPDGDGVTNYDEGLYKLDPNKKDTDGDGVDDKVEIQTRKDKNGDADGDSITNLEEIYLKTDPNKKDTDGDGFDDGVEVQTGHDPLKP